MVERGFQIQTGTACRRPAIVTGSVFWFEQCERRFTFGHLVFNHEVNDFPPFNASKIHPADYSRLQRRGECLLTASWKCDGIADELKFSCALSKWRVAARSWRQGGGGVFRGERGRIPGKTSQDEGH